MAVSYVRYKARDGAGVEHNLYVPRWTEGSMATINRGWKTPNEIEALTANFPFPGTWFVATNSAKTILASMGIINVYVISDIVNSGYAHWDIIGANGLTGGYMEFTTTSSDTVGYINFFHPLFGNNSFHQISVFSPESTSQNSDRMHTMPSDQFYTVNDTPRVCFARAQNMRTDSETHDAGLYFYQTEGKVPYYITVDKRLQIEAFYGGTPIPETHQITYHLVHATGDPNNPTEIPVGTTSSTIAQFVPENHYTLKYGSVLKTSDNTPVGDEVSWEWSEIGGYIRIFGDVPYDITIEVIGVADAYPIDPSEPTDPPDPSSINYDFTYDPIPMPDLPQIQAVEAGFFNVYLPTPHQVNELAAYLWSSSFDAANFKKMFNNPMEAIMGLHLVPLNIDDIENYDDYLIYGNNSTGIAMKRAEENWISVDMGNITVPEYYSAYMSYSPYTKIQIYLPFIGTQQLDADVIAGRTVHLKYNIDIVSGSCVALIGVFFDDQEGGTVEIVQYQFSGCCSCELPVTQGDYKNILQTIQSVVASSVGLGVSSSSSHGSHSIANSNGVRSSGFSSTNFNRSLTGNLANGITALGSSIEDMIKPTITTAGNISSSSGYLSVKTPYLIISTPKLCIPETQQNDMGFPIYGTIRISELHHLGFTVIEAIHLEGFGVATTDELDELEEILKTGVIF